MLIAVAACGGSPSPEPSPTPSEPPAATATAAPRTASPSPSPTATVTSEAGPAGPAYAPDTRTGIDAIDELIPLILAGDADAILERLEYVDAPFATDEADPIPGPFCPAGVADGTHISVFGSVGCEVHVLDRSLVRGFAVPDLHLFAVYHVDPSRSDPDLAGVYGLAFAGTFAGAPEAGVRLVVVTADGEGRIVQWFSSCGGVDPHQFMSEFPVAGYVLPPIK